MAKPAKKKVEKAKRPKAIAARVLPVAVEAPAKPAKKKIAKAKTPKATTTIKVLAPAPIAKPVKLAKAVRQIEKRVRKPAHDSAAAGVLERLWGVIEQRRVMGDAATSHSARLLARGTQKVAQKLGEEAVELVIEAVARNREATISESADLLYHLLVLWVDAGVAPDDVWRELCRREGISGIAEKAARPAGIIRAAGTRKLP
jgi:phosphoribosyl-ATP pyrophosphohydrolase